MRIFHTQSCYGSDSRNLLCYCRCDVAFWCAICVVVDFDRKIREKVFIVETLDGMKINLSDLKWLEIAEKFDHKLNIIPRLDKTPKVQDKIVERPSRWRWIRKLPSETSVMNQICFSSIKISEANYHHEASYMVIKMERLHPDSVLNSFVLLKCPKRCNSLRDEKSQKIQILIKLWFHYRESCA